MKSRPSPDSGPELSGQPPSPSDTPASHSSTRGLLLPSGNALSPYTATVPSFLECFIPPGLPRNPGRSAKALN